MPNRPDAASTLILLTLILILGLFLAGVTVLNYSGADRWWFGALNLYLRRAIWAIPGIVLTMATAMVNRRLLWAPLLCVLWVLGPLMGFCWSWQTPPEEGQTALKVMSCNVKYGMRHIPSLFAEIDLECPDVVLLQDATGLWDSSVGDYFRKWNVRRYGQFVIASRLPLEEAEVTWLDFPDQVERQSALRCRLRIDNSVVTLYDVHFHSPREALSLLPAAIKRAPLRELMANRLAENATTRYVQAHTLAQLIRRETGPVIVAGDLNSPDGSLPCATLRDAGLHDAFAQGGRGYGYSYGQFLIPHHTLLPRFSFIRIDHILMSSEIKTVRSWIGTPNASDHRPVYAHLVIQSSRSSSK